MAATDHDDLGTRLLRMLVPASLAGGIVALYPAISDQVVERFGMGFRPGLVAIYVATLVLLFLLDAFLRDRRLEWMRTLAADAERRADLEQERSKELSLLLDVASALEGDERLEGALLDALERLRTAVPYSCAAVLLREEGSNALHRSGVSPLTAVPSDAAVQAAEACARDGTIGEGDAVIAIPLRARGVLLGAIVYEGVDVQDAAIGARLLAATDRIGSAIAHLKLVSELADKERALRQAWRELRHSGSRLARQSGRAEAAALAEVAGAELCRPAEEALRELKRLRRAVPRPAGEAGRGNGPGGESPGASAADASLDAIEERLRAIRGRATKLVEHAGRREPASEVVLADLIVAAVDLVAPELKRAKIEVRLAFDRGVGAVRVSEGPLFHLVVRLVRRLRAELRRTPAPRRLWIETQAFGSGARIRLRANTAGIGAAPGGGDRPESRTDKELRESTPRRRGYWKPAGVTIRREEAPGDGVAYCVSIHPEKAESAAAEGLAGRIGAEDEGPRPEGQAGRSL